MNNSVQLSFKVYSSDGTLLDQTADGETASITLGQGALPEKLEDVLSSSPSNTEQTIPLTAVEAYGERDESLVTWVLKDQFSGLDLVEGMRLEAQLSDDATPEHVWVREIQEGRVLVDLNHPLAGMDLTFVVMIHG